MKWLVSAFEPFGGASSNSSWDSLIELQKVDWQGRVEFCPQPIPVTFAGAWPALREHIRLSSCDGVLALGQAGGRSRLSLERVALNWIDTRAPDNCGTTPAQEPIDTSGAPLIWSAIPWERLKDSPLWERSYSAGTFVCNALMYELARWSQASGRLSGFVHIPAFENAGMSVQSAEGLTQILSFLTAL